MATRLKELLLIGGANSNSDRQFAFAGGLCLVIAGEPIYGDWLPRRRAQPTRLPAPQSTPSGDARGSSRSRRSAVQMYDAPDCAYGGEIKSIEAVDDLTVKFSLCVPDPAFPSKAAFSAFAIHPSEYLTATGGGGDLLEKPIGTGPYQLKEWRRGDSSS